MGYASFLVPHLSMVSTLPPSLTTISENFAISAIVWTVGYKKEKFNWWVFLSMVVPVIALPLFFEMETFIFNQVSKGFVKYILIVVQYVLPICLPFLTKAACAKDGREKKTSGAGRVKGEAV